MLKLKNPPLVPVWGENKVDWPPPANNVFVEGAVVYVVMFALLLPKTDPNVKENDAFGVKPPWLDWLDWFGSIKKINILRIINFISFLLYGIC